MYTWSKKKKRKRKNPSWVLIFLITGGKKSDYNSNYFQSPVEQNLLSFTYINTMLALAAYSSTSMLETWRSRDSATWVRASRLCACVCKLDKNVRKSKGRAKVLSLLTHHKLTAHMAQKLKPCSRSDHAPEMFSYQNFLHTIFCHHAAEEVYCSHPIMPLHPPSLPELLGDACRCTLVQLLVTIFLFCGAENKQAFLNWLNTDKGRVKRAKIGAQTEI